jgi:hypothetical protein
MTKTSKNHQLLVEIASVKAWLESITNETLNCAYNRVSRLKKATREAERTVELISSVRKILRLQDELAALEAEKEIAAKKTLKANKSIKVR